MSNESKVLTAKMINDPELDIEPIDDTVIVEVRKIEEKTKGGILLTKSVIDKDQMFEDEGILVAYGPLAFYTLSANNAEVPQLGSKVYFKKHSGIVHDNENKTKVYRCILDKDIYVKRRTTNVE
jgi:co-chaperonin GroES (HSP10)